MNQPQQLLVWMSQAQGSGQKVYTTWQPPHCDACHSMAFLCLRKVSVSRCFSVMAGNESKSCSVLIVGKEPWMKGVWCHAGSKASADERWCSLNSNIYLFNQIKDALNLWICKHIHTEYACNIIVLLSCQLLQLFPTRGTFTSVVSQRLCSNLTNLKK